MSGSAAHQLGKNRLLKDLGRIRQGSLALQTIPCQRKHSIDWWMLDVIGRDNKLCTAFVDAEYMSNIYRLASCTLISLMQPPSEAPANLIDENRCDLIDT